MAAVIVDGDGREQWDPIFFIDVGVLLCAGLIWFSFRLVAVEPPDPPRAAGE